MWVVSSFTSPPPPKERAPSTHCRGGWVGPRTVWVTWRREYCLSFIGTHVSYLIWGSHCSDWDTMLSSLVKVISCFREHYFHLQVRRVSVPWNQSEAEQSLMLVSCLAYFLAQKVEMVCSPETSVDSLDYMVSYPRRQVSWCILTVLRLIINFWRLC
jgi:hypothetical protein